MRFGFGEPLTRQEDDALLRGRGRYVDDHLPASVLHAAVLRSPHAHARFAIQNIQGLRALPGVALVLTGTDTAKLGHLPCQADLPNTKISVPPYPILVREEVRQLGDAIASVVAETPTGAREAREAAVIEWEPLPVVVGTAAALDRVAPLVWPKIAGNLAFDTELGDARAVDEAFARAADTV